MKTISKFPSIALIFSVLCVLTSAILVFSVARWIQWIFAAFWLGTGILGFVVAVRKK